MEQYRFGIVDVPDSDYVSILLTFNSLPDASELRRRANLLADYAHFIGAKEVMIGGALFFMPYLIDALNEYSITSYFAFSKRVSEDIIQEDGSVLKRSVFVMEGLIKNN
ncbi:MAG: hypothetical protein Q4C49_13735 [Bacillota bacterium]|nr:hypothetical protein [Bacillota bacterium]